MLFFALACTPTTTDKVAANPGRDSADTGTGDTDKDSADSDSAANDSGDTGEIAEGCRATPPSADRDRAVFVSLPYNDRGRAANTWARLTLTTEGELMDDNLRFEMGRAYGGEIVFTPDGEIALAAQDDGTLAVFREDGTVISEGVGGFYAVKIVMDPSGEMAWVVDGNWQNNGGGIYRLPIDCETGEPGEPERVIEAKLPADILLENADAVVIGREVTGSADGDDLARVSWPEGVFSAGADAFGDDDAVVTDALRWNDWLLIGDNSAFSGVPTRVAVVSASDLTPRGSFEVEDPIALANGGEFVIIASGYGDEILGAVPDETGMVASTFRVSASELPSGISILHRGALDGLLLIAEVSGVHMVNVGPEGSADDLGVFALGDSYEGIVGAIGIAP